MKSSVVVGHIFCRELLDQWRDRRTLLTVIFLPLLLYPILGLGLLQVTQFMGDKPTRILVVGAQHLQGEAWSSLPPLLDESGWNPTLLDQETLPFAVPIFTTFVDPRAEVAAQQLMVLGDSESSSSQRWRELLQNELQTGGGDALLWIAPPADAPENLGLRSTANMTGNSPTSVIGKKHTTKPQLHLFQNLASDQSQVATRRVESILNQWYLLTQRQATEDPAPPASLVPFQYAASNIAAREQMDSQVWSKILPFILFLWTLTGAFYCAVDLCAGEKERGTLEALLVTPATRGQIVVGKLLTTMAFSFTSGMVNLMGTVTTGTFVAHQMSALTGPAGSPGFGPPPWSALVWLVVGAIPISALFSAISLAVAAFARSTKEGQHYLMPVLMICFPLLTLPILPGMQLDLGMSLLPISGVLFWLRALIEGEYGLAARFTLPVLLVNGWCVYLAIYWAVVQFTQEAVLFRPVERFSLVAWLRALLKRQSPLPTLGQVVLLMALIFTLKLGLQAIAPSPDGWTNFVWHTVIILSGAVALPAIGLALISTQSFFESLRLAPTTTRHVLAAFALAICFHPLIVMFQQFVMQLYPLKLDAFQLHESFNAILLGAPGFWAILLLMALAPAVCEELAFRGFILSGLKRWTTPVNAVILTAILFGATHGLLQQSIVAMATGVVLGFLALRTGSLWPCIVYHATHNALTLQFAFLDQERIRQSRLYDFLLETQVNEQGQLISLSYAGLPAAFLLISGFWICLSLISTDSAEAPSDKPSSRWPGSGVPSVSEGSA